jgi:hypothetical protein
VEPKKTGLPQCHTFTPCINVGLLRLWSLQDCRHGICANRRCRPLEPAVRERQLRMGSEPEAQSELRVILNSDFDDAAPFVSKRSYRANLGAPQRAAQNGGRGQRSAKHSCGACTCDYLLGLQTWFG